MRLVSVVIPLYNAETTIYETVVSVVNQSYENIEIIIVNDGSEDKSAEIVFSLIKEFEDKKIVFLEQNNLGVSVARNKGIIASRGEFIAFLDSDDQWLKEKIEKQINVFDNYGIELGLVSCNRNDEVFSYLDEVSFLSIKKLLLKNLTITPTVIIRKKTILEAGFFDEEMTHAEDLNFFIKCLSKAKGVILNKSLVITGGGKPSYGHSGLSANIDKMIKGEIINLKYCRKMRFISNVDYFLFRIVLLVKSLKRKIELKLR